MVMRIVGGVPVDARGPRSSEPGTISGNPIDTALTNYAPVTKPTVQADSGVPALPTSPSTADPLSADPFGAGSSAGQTTDNGGSTATSTPPLVVPPPPSSVPGNTGAGGDATGYVPAPMPPPPPTDDIDHTSNPYPNGYPTTDPAGPGANLGGDVTAGQGITEVAPSAPLTPTPSAPIPSGGGGAIHGNPEALTPSDVNPSTPNPPDLPPGEIQVLGNTTTGTTAPPAAPPVDTSPAPPPIEESFPNPPDSPPVGDSSTPISNYGTTPPAATPPAPPVATPPVATPPVVTPPATPAAPDTNNAAQQAIVMQLLASLMGGQYQNIDFTDPTAAAGAANPDTGTAAPFASANVTPIDPMNDLRDKMITPATDDLTEQARQHMADAQNNLSSFDRGTTTQNAMTAFAPDQSQVAPINPGKDVSGLLDQADAGTMAKLGQLNATDRQALVDSLFSDYTNKLGNTDVQAGGPISTAPSDRLKALEGQVDQATTGLGNIDRVALAKQMFDTFQQQTDPSYQLAIRQATQKGAATGGLGSGQLRTDYGNLALARTRDLQGKQQELIQQAISDSINDALNKQARLASLEGQLSSEEAGLRGEQRTDRQYQTDVNTGNVNRGLATRESALGMAGSGADSNLSAIEQALAANRGVTSDLAGRQQQLFSNQNTNRATALNQFNADRGFADQFASEKAGDLANSLNGASGVFGQTATEEANRRNELRTERGYEVGQEQSAFDRALAQYQAEQAAQNNRFGQGLSLLGAASGGNPAGVLASLGQGGGDLSAIISQLAAAMGRGSAAGGGSTQAGAGAIPGGSGSPADNPAIAQIIQSLSGLGVQTTPGGSAPTTPAGGIDTEALNQLIASMSGGG
jgi:hypothetical protein